MITIEKILLAFVLLTILHLSHGAPRHIDKRNKSHKKNDSATSRSYIDIDASDPFKVPKSSQYIDQPVPEFVHRATDKGDPNMPEMEDDENSEPPPKAFDNIQDDLKHLGLDNVGNSGDESRFKSNPEAPDDSNHEEPPAAVDQENGANEQTKPAEPEDGGQQMKGNPGESAQSRQFVPHDDESYEDDEKKK